MKNYSQKGNTHNGQLCQENKKRSYCPTYDIWLKKLNGFASVRDTGESIQGTYLCQK